VCLTQCTAVHEKGKESTKESDAVVVPPPTESEGSAPAPKRFWNPPKDLFPDRGPPPSDPKFLFDWMLPESAKEWTDEGRAAVHKFAFHCFGVEDGSYSFSSLGISRQGTKNVQIRILAFRKSPSYGSY
jgi:hypothetical protein